MRSNNRIFRTRVVTLKFCYAFANWAKEECATRITLRKERVYHSRQLIADARRPGRVVTLKNNSEDS